MSESECIGHEPCPECGSRDNLGRYDDGHGYCFGCGYWEPGEGQAGGQQEKKVSKSVHLEDAHYGALPSRRISEETCKKYGYQKAKVGGKPAQVANYRRGGDLVAQKVRFKNKDFIFVGDDVKHSGLYGQHLFREGGKMLSITEGEIDAMSLSQMQGNKWPVVSVPTGAQGAAKSIAKELEWVESFDKVVFMFDMDVVGQQAAKECAALLSPGKAFIGHLPSKDPNECLVNGQVRECLSAMWDAAPFRPDGIVDVEELIDDACQDIEIGKDWPWQGMNLTYGRRRGELYGFGGGTGCGKSTIFKQIALHIIENDKLPVGMLMLEEQPKLTLKTLAGMHMGARVHVPGVEYDRDELRQAAQDLAGRVYFYDHFGSADWDVIKGKIRYMVHALGIRDIFLDHLTALAAAVDDDERKAIDKMMAELSSLTQELDCTIYYISHLTTPEGKPHEEGGRVLEKHFRGSRSIIYWSHFLFGIERNKQDLDGVTTFRILKDRYTGDANGVTFGLDYDRKTGHLKECALPGDDFESQFGNTSGGDF